MPFGWVQPALTSWSRRAEDLTRDKTDDKDAVLIARLTAQWEGGGMALVGMVATALALAWWDATTDTGALARFVVVAAVTGTIGLVRFVALRWAFGVTRTVEEV